MPEETPLISVLMTAYNRQNFIGEAIESVVASTYTQSELIIVDDCSTDKTVAIAESYAIRDKRIKVHINDKNLGQFENRNKAAGYAKGVYLKYVDSDDVIYPYTLQVMINGMLAFPEAALGFCHTINESEKPFPYLIKPADAYRKHYFGGGLLYTGPIGLIIKSEVFRALEGFKAFGMPSDNHLSLRIAATCPVVALPRDLFWWRQHNEGRAFDELDSLKNIFDHFLFNRDILENKNCPLSEKEKGAALTSGKKNFSRGVLRRLIYHPSDFKLLKFLLETNQVNMNFILRNLL